jgi:Zn-dependent protease
MNVDAVVYVLSYALIPLLFAITVHEVAHGWVAKRYGDPTAAFAGRLTLNPIKHIDPIGTLAVPIALLYFSGGQMAFGWAKPVPVAFNNLNNPRRDMILVAAGGPAANFVMALGWAILLGGLLLIGQNSSTTEWLFRMFGFGITINVLLAVFNMLPIPPLDGGRVLAGLLPPRWSDMLDRIEPFGFLVVIVLLVTGVLFTLLSPFLNYFQSFFLTIAAAIAGL